MLSPWHNAPVQAIKLPIAGRARFVTQLVEFDAPVALPGLPPLRVDGIGALSFGDLTVAVMDALVSEFGEPSGEGGSPLGHPLRYVNWEDVSLVAVFSDYGFFRDDRQEHLAGWILGVDPSPMTTTEGIGVGSTLAELEEAYPGRVVL